MPLHVSGDRAYDDVVWLSSVRLPVFVPGSCSHPSPPLLGIRQQSQRSADAQRHALQRMWHVQTSMVELIDACYVAEQDIIEAAFEHSVDGGASNVLLGSRLHDFGFRGCTCVEQVWRAPASRLQVHLGC